MTDAQGPTVLIVGPEPEIRRLAAAILTRRGLIVRTAVDAADALDRLAPDRPDAVLVDVSPPQADVPALAHALRRRAPALPIGLMSIDPDEAARFGLPTLAMPFSIAELVAFTMTLLAERPEG